MSPELAGRIMLGIGVVGVAVALVATLLASRLLGTTVGEIDRTIALSAELLTTVDESFVVAEEALVIVTDGTEEAAGAVQALGRSLEAGSGALDGARDLTGGSIADAVDDIEQALPAVQQAAAAIESTLRTLDRLPLGLDYAPARSLAETVGELRVGLEGLPEELREQAEAIEGTADSLEEATAGTVATGDALGELVGRMEEATRLVGTYGQQTADAQRLVTEQRETLATNLTQTRILLWVVGVMVAMGMFVPITLGRYLMDGRFVLIDAPVRTA